MSPWAKGLLVGVALGLSQALAILVGVLIGRALS